MNIKPANVVGQKFNIGGMRDAVESLHCVPEPMGCGRELTLEEIGRWDSVTQKEYTMSGWCNTCQDKVFKDPEDDEPEECTHVGSCEEYNEKMEVGKIRLDHDGYCVCTCADPCCSVDVGGDDVGPMILTCEKKHCRVHGEGVR